MDGVIENGVNGWQYDGAADFSRCLTEFCQDGALRRQMAEAAWASAEKFSAEAFGAAAERLYRSVQGQPLPMASGGR